MRSGLSGVPVTASLRRQLTMPSPIIPSPMKPIFVMMIITPLLLRSLREVMRCGVSG